MEYNKLSDEIIAKLQALVGVQNVVTDAGQMEIYAHDEVTDPAIIICLRLSYCGKCTAGGSCGQTGE